jgi:hypothetical protein
VKPTGLFLVVGVLGLGLLVIAWSALEQIGSLPSDRAVTTATPAPGIDCWSPAPPGLSHPVAAGGRWMFVRHGGTGGYLLAEPGRELPLCSGADTAHR